MADRDTAGLAFNAHVLPLQAAIERVVASLRAGNDSASTPSAGNMHLFVQQLPAAAHVNWYWRRQTAFRVAMVLLFLMQPA
jgi:hypothetical protein